MISTTFDSIVIGAGSAGIAFATTAAKLGAKVLIVERDALGGTCVNRGCVPKKILWSAGDLVLSARDAAAQGMSDDFALRFDALVHKRDAHIESIRASFAEEFEEAGVTLVRGDARLIDAQSVEVDATRYTAEQVILATGGRPTPLDIDGYDHLEDSSDVLSWTYVPDAIVIVGGGYIGCEFAAMFNAFGADVTLIHDGPHVLDTFAEPLARHVQDGLVASGITLRLDDAVTSVSKDGDRLRYALKSGGSGMADHVVAAIGRTPNIDTLGPVADDLDVADTGALSVDGTLQTSMRGLYAVGDVADRLPLTPVGTTDGTALAHILHGDGAPLCDLDGVATTTFVYPPAAFVGTVAQDSARTGTTTPLQDKVLRPGGDHTSHMYRIGIDADTRALTGAQIVGQHADDMIALAAALVAAKAPADALTRATPIHPSFAEEFYRDI